MKLSNFERKYSPGYRHMICIGKTKSTSEKGVLCLEYQVFSSLHVLLLPSQPVELFHMTSQRPYWCSKTKPETAATLVYQTKPLGSELLFHANFSFCGVKLTWPLVTWVKTFYSYFEKGCRKKVRATILKGIVGDFKCTIFQRNLKESYGRPLIYVCECWRKVTKVGSTATVVRNSVLIISHINFRDCRVHFILDKLSRNNCILGFYCDVRSSAMFFNRKKKKNTVALEVNLILGWYVLGYKHGNRLFV